MHTFLILRGISTLEAGDDGPRPYDFGPRRNWELVFGSVPRLWFWPVVTKDVRAATASGTYFKGYIGDAGYATRFRLLVELERRTGLGVEVTDDDDDDDGSSEAPISPAPTDRDASETATLL